IYISPEPTGLCAEMQFFGQWLVVVNPIGVTSTTLTQDCLRQAMDAWAGSVEVTAMPVLLGVVLGTLMGALAGFLVGMLVLRLRAAYLALFTLGFSEILKATISAEIDITRGQAGLELPALYPSGITLFGTYFEPTDKIPPYYTMLGLLLICLAVLGWLAHSRFGLFVRALREDQDAAAALGVNTTRYKVLVFTFTCAMAAAAGAVQGHYVQIITPNMLFLLQMSLVVAMAVIGGIENFVAAAIGAIILQVLLELLRNSFVIGGVEVDMTIWRLVFFGILLMITLRFFRNGLIAPLIARFRRRGVAEETVAGRASTVTGPEGGPHRTEAPD
ncbi:MAG: branched-chain amino acid ABC transporter permease, partial [Roseovarius sp.]|nr:branched-chain amino acid ABC transporter permease [Roseovarius sp.]